MTISRISAAFAAPILLSLAACSGGSGGSGSDGLPEGQLRSAEAMADRLDPDNPQFTDVATLPMIGGAQYNGFMGIFLDGNSIDDEDADPSAIGDVQLDVAFDSGDVTGNVSNVSDSDGRLGGQLALDGSFDRTAADDSALGLGLSGTLQTQEGSDATVSGTFSGGFVGDNHEGLVAEGVGNVGADGVIESFDAVMIGER